MAIDEFEDLEEFSDFEEFAELDPAQRKERTEGHISHIPAIKNFIETYAKSLEGNDKKACELFKQYEAQEKLRRLQTELMQMKDEKISRQTCDLVVGKKRKGLHGTYLHWAELMLLWLNQAKY